STITPLPRTRKIRSPEPMLPPRTNDSNTSNTNDNNTLKNNDNNSSKTNDNIAPKNFYYASPKPPSPKSYNTFDKPISYYYGSRDKVDHSLDSYMWYSTGDDD
ncbi:25076_t:CDS:2, partial [Gigaspora margarita]